MKSHLLLDRSAVLVITAQQEVKSESLVLLARTSLVPTRTSQDRRRHTARTVSLVTIAIPEVVKTQDLIVRQDTSVLVQTMKRSPRSVQLDHTA